MATLETNEGMKRKTRNMILDVLEKQGLDKSKRLAYSLIDTTKKVSKENNLGTAKHNVLKGEIAEVILELYLRDFVNKHENSFYSKGLLVPLPDGMRSGRSDFTELDLTLVTCIGIFMFEVKAYAGNITISDKCLVKTSLGVKSDVYGQSAMHRDALHYWIREILPNPKVYKLAFMLNTKGEVKDKRPKKTRLKVPYLHDSNIREYLNGYRYDTQIVNVKKIYRVFKKMNTDQDRKFIAHVNALKGGK